MGRPVDPRKDSAILEAARATFLSQPFERVSMDAIARNSGVSKVTIYAKYKSKEGLFVAAMNEACQDVQLRMRENLELGGPIADMLLQLGHDFMTMILAPDMAAMHAAMVRAGEKQPELPRQFFDFVVLPMLDALAGALEAGDARGAIVCPNPRRSAIQFIALVQGIYRYEVELKVAKTIPPDELSDYLNGCVDLFLAGHRA
jgi:TetR/AcrR family transcriptional regulator, mexJK operon transcriptional repressor